MEEKSHEITSFNHFWNDYFIPNWVDEDTRIHFITTWNMFNIINLDKETKDTILINKSNNALESYNKHLNEQCKHSHPTMSHFVQIIKED